ncbi:uncharacterized protein LOC132730259 [Ruditapes philippinarum]|uniref:uncharacterized protein LOC132730259 n=1 Tax=Ruditapes philippinarum TaxID=129788 RepID=UPI00295A7A29|nr:uncharacterized protein LOC132730259 [Ruditapes philippinarum]
MEVSGKKPLTKISSPISHSSEEDFKLFCTPCDRVGPRLPAFGFCIHCNEHLCQNCFQHHKVATPSRHHVLLDRESMPKTHLPSKTTPNAQDDLTKSCLRHKNKMIEYYCFDHSKLLCNVCVTLEHNPNSCTVKFIPDISGEVIDSQELEHVKTKMDTIIQECNTVEKTCKVLTTESDNSLAQALNNIKAYRAELNKKLDEMENAVEVKVKYFLEENKQRLHSAETICEDVSKSVTALKASIIETNKAKQPDRLFIDMKIAHQEICEYSASVKDLKEVLEVNAYHFQPNTSIKTSMNSITTLGLLESEQLSTKMNTDQPKLFTVPRRRPFENFTENVKQNRVPMSLFKQNDMPYYGDLCVRAKSDTIRCWITGMTQLNFDHLVVVDHNNMSVKIFQTKEKNPMKSAIKMPSKPWDVAVVPKPWDVAVVPNNEIAVTLPYDNVIQFLSTKSNMLSTTHTVTVQGKCSGISYCDNKMVVTYIDPLKCEIMDIKGTVLVQINGQIDNKYTMVNPSYVKCTNQEIYISDNGARRIIKLNCHGSIIDSFSVKGQYKGISLSNDRTLYVCEQGSDSNILQILEDFKTRKKVIDQYRCPQTICCWDDWDNGLLYISNHRYTDTDNFLTVYRNK